MFSEMIYLRSRNRNRYTCAICTDSRGQVRVPAFRCLLQISLGCFLLVELDEFLGFILNLWQHLGDSHSLQARIQMQSLQKSFAIQVSRTNLQRCVNISEMMMITTRLRSYGIQLQMHCQYANPQVTYSQLQVQSRGFQPVNSYDFAITGDLGSSCPEQAYNPLVIP